MANFQKFDNPVLAGMQMGQASQQARGSDMRRGVSEYLRQQLSGQQAASLRDLDQLHRYELLATNSYIGPDGKPANPAQVLGARNFLRSPEGNARYNTQMYNSMMYMVSPASLGAKDTAGRTLEETGAFPGLTPYYDRYSRSGPSRYGYGTILSPTVTKERP